ncbi:MAG TPA: hypothetical protein VEK11_01775 [Thermoanaerobaculia bacterium]|jgi:hypothetical protein|nr:hypothetical protein [Thermoanaerobaculia bacterium]
MKIASIHKANDDDHPGSRRRDAGELGKPSAATPKAPAAADPKHQRTVTQVRQQPKK